MISLYFSAGSSDNLLGGITASSPGGPKGFQPTGGAFKSTHADTSECYTAFVFIHSNSRVSEFNGLFHFDIISPKSDRYL